MYRIFVGFKAAIQVVKQYQLFCETQDTGVFNSESIYQSSIRRMILTIATIENRPREYTTYKDAYTFNKDIICGTYLIVKEALAGKRVEIPFKFSLTEIPELQFFDDYCNAVFGNFDFQLRVDQIGNIVWCMGDPEQVVLKDETMHILAMTYLYTIRNTFINYPKEFIQCGTAPLVVQFAGPIDNISVLAGP